MEREFHQYGSSALTRNRAGERISTRSANDSDQTPRTTAEPPESLMDTPNAKQHLSTSMLRTPAIRISRHTMWTAGFAVQHGLTLPDTRHPHGPSTRINPKAVTVEMSSNLSDRLGDTAHSSQVRRVHTRKPPVANCSELLPLSVGRHNIGVCGSRSNRRKHCPRRP